jgi:hypothetical protein
MKRTRHSCPILMKLEFSGQSLEKYFGIKFYENPPSGSRVVSSGQTDRHDGADSRFPKFYERA